MAKNYLKDWNTLNAHIQDLSEAQCEKLLAEEKASKEPRPSFLRRLQGRINKLRGRREQMEHQK